MPLIRIADAGNKRHYAQLVTAQPNDANGATSGRRAINIRDGSTEILLRFFEKRRLVSRIGPELCLLATRSPSGSDSNIEI